MIGSAAAVVHLAVAAAGLRAHLAPQLANVLGFHVAFVVSYLGHRKLTFADRATRVRDSLPKFLAVSYASFALNATLYALLLRLTRLHELLALAIVLVTVAAVTYTLGKAWAFRQA